MSENLLRSSERLVGHSDAQERILESKGSGRMKVKEFIMEDDHGKEFIVVCEKPYRQPKKIFALKGWQRRRMVPLQCTGQELRQITGEC